MTNQMKEPDNLRVDIEKALKRGTKFYDDDDGRKLTTVDEVVEVIKRKGQVDFEGPEVTIIKKGEK